MEEIEVPTEHLHEQLHEKAHETKDQWTMRVALTAALLAVFAAVTSLLAGHYSNEAMIEQLKASDQWAYYQAKGIKAAVLDSKSGLLMELGKEINAADKEKADKYREEQKEIDRTAREKEKVSVEDLVLHNILAKGVTIFQVAIALCAIAALTGRKWLWFLSIGLGFTGMIFLGLAIF